jgi:hypothetical protein
MTMLTTLFCAGKLLRGPPHCHIFGGTYPFKVRVLGSAHRNPNNLRHVDGCSSLKVFGRGFNRQAALWQKLSHTLCISLVRERKRSCSKHSAGLWHLAAFSTDDGETLFCFCVHVVPSRGYRMALTFAQDPREIYSGFCSC